MFELSQSEFKSLIDNMRSQIVTSQWKSTTYAPYVFTEHGVLQLAHVLRSFRAKKMSIRIIEVFVKMRELIATHKDILQKLEELQKNDLAQDEKIERIFQYLEQLEKLKQQEIEQANRQKIGFLNQ
jgi:vacuolar-type H+-ATPase subunit I/STV1